MKKRFYPIGLIFLLLLAACVSESETSNKDYLKELEEEIQILREENETLKKQVQTETKEDLESTEEKQDSQVDLSADQVWEVEGLIRLNIESAIATEERNEFSDKKAKQVVILNYSYENIGYEGEYMDLYLSPKYVLDGTREVSFTYPAQISYYPKAIPIGSKITGVQEAYGLNNESEAIEVCFEFIENDGTKHIANFQVPITEVKE